MQRGAMAYVRERYNVPAKRGAEVLFTGLKFPVAGRILSADSQAGYLWIRTQDGRRFGPLHPTWQLEYLDR